MNAAPSGPSWKTPTRAGNARALWWKDSTFSKRRHRQPRGGLGIATRASLPLPAAREYIVAPRPGRYANFFLRSATRISPLTPANSYIYDQAPMRSGAASALIGVASPVAVVERRARQAHRALERAGHSQGHAPLLRGCNGRSVSSITSASRFRPARGQRTSSRDGHLRRGSLQPCQPLVDPGKRGFQLSLRSLAAKNRIVDPPVHAHLLGLVHRTDHQADLYGKQLNVHQLNLDIAGNNHAFVQHPLEDIGQSRTLQRMRNWLGHNESPVLKKSP